MTYTFCAVKEPASSTETYCVCQQGESGTMIACDSTYVNMSMVMLTHIKTMFLAEHTL